MGTVFVAVREDIGGGGGGGGDGGGLVGSGIFISIASCLYSLRDALCVYKGMTQLPCTLRRLHQHNKQQEKDILLPLTGDEDCQKVSGSVYL